MSATATGVGFNFFGGGGDGFAGDEFGLWLAATGADRLFWGAGAGFTEAAESEFDDTVFDGVEADDSETAAGGEEVEGGENCFFEAAEFVINGDAEGLEDLGSGVLFLAVAATAIVAFDGVSELVSGVEGAVSDEAAGEAAATGEVGVAPENIGEVFSGPVIDDIASGGALGGIKAHIERAILAPREAAGGVIELTGGEAEVEEDAMEGGEVMLGGVVGHSGVMVMDEGNAIDNVWGGCLELGTGEANGFGVTVEGEETSGGGDSGG